MAGIQRIEKRQMDEQRINRQMTEEHMNRQKKVQINIGTEKQSNLLTEEQTNIGTDNRWIRQTVEHTEYHKIYKRTNRVPYKQMNTQTENMQTQEKTHRRTKEIYENKQTE